MIIAATSARKAAAWGSGLPCVLALILAAFVWSPTARAMCPSKDESRNLLLITVDTLRADHLGVYGYFRDTSPVIDAFAVNAVVFERAFAPIATTLPSHLSMMTGLYPGEHGITSNFRHLLRAVEREEGNEGPRMLASALRQCGFRTAGFTSASPLAAATGIDIGFEHFVGPDAISMERGRIDIRAEVTIDRALRWLQGINDEERYFLWVHLFDPHDPYDPPKAYRRFSTDQQLTDLMAERQIKPAHQAQAAQWINRYDGEILYADAQIGRVLTALDERRSASQTITIIIGDHGEGLMQHENPRHEDMWNEQLRVPWLMHIPGVAAQRVQTLVSLVDLVPLLGGLGFPPLAHEPSGIDVLNNRRGSLLAQSDPSNRRPQGHVIVTDDWKLWDIWQKPDRLYRTSDKGELRNVADFHPEVVQDLKALLDRRLQDWDEAEALPTRLTVSEERLRQLRSLGYIQ